MTNINKKNLAVELPLKENIFGFILEDNYRYFEDKSNKLAIEWMTNQSKITRQFLDENNLSKNIYNEFLEIDKFQKIKHYYFFNKKKNIYYLKRCHSEKKGKLFRTNYKTKQEEFLFDFDTLNEAHKGEVVMQEYNVSPNEKYLSFLIGVNGSENGFMYIFNLNTKRLEREVFDKSRSYTACWLDDENFIYIKFPNIFKADDTTFKNMELKFHKIGNSIHNDKIIFSAKTNLEIKDIANTNWYTPYYDRLSKMLYIMHSKNTDLTESLYVKKIDNFNDLVNKKIPFKRIISFDNKIKSILILNKKIYFITSFFGDKFQFRTSDILDFDIKKSKLIEIPKNEILDEVIYRDLNDIYCLTIRNNYNKLYKLEKNTSSLVNINTEFKGVIYLSYDIHDEMLIKMSNTINPSKVYCISNKNETVLKEFVNDEIKLDLTKFNTEIIEYVSHDGVKVLMTITYKNGLCLDGKNKCLIHAYGSYGMSYLPNFNIENYRWINNGGIIAIAHVRGGGEKGKYWHDAGKKRNKPNTWKDLIFAGKYMIKHKYTSSKYLACEGTSAGGITVGMTANEAPEVFNAILFNVGLGSTIRIGSNPGGGLSENGDPKNENDFESLLKMDVFQNVMENQKYPNMLFTAGLKDDRVDAWQPAKVCAKIQKSTSSQNRVSFILYDNLGHGGFGSSREVYLKYLADQFAFLDKVLA